MKSKKIFFLAFIASLGCLYSCSNDDTPVYDDSGLTDALITSFALADNDKYASNLSELHFTINQYGKVLPDNEITGDNQVGLIYNADSLPVGTITSKLVANMSFNSPQSVTLYTASDTTEYVATDSIDFSKPVIMKVVAANGVTDKFYQIKVNVHTQVPDSIHWSMIVDPLADVDLIESQKCVHLGSSLYWIIRNFNNETYTYVAEDTNLKQWSRVSTAGLENGILSSLTVFNNEFYVVNDDHTLSKSSDGQSWQTVSTTFSFENLIASYESEIALHQLMAITINNGSYYFATSSDAIHWTEKEQLPSTFPIQGFSNTLQYLGGVYPTIVLMGGELADGTLSNRMWAFDGINPWFRYQSSVIPAVKGGSLISYENDPRYLNTFWLFVGGEKANQNFNSTIYKSIDKGVTWEVATEEYAFPSAFTPRAFSSVFVDNNFYIHLIGGQSANENFNSIWSGRINSLGFKPVE